MSPACPGTPLSTQGPRHRLQGAQPRAPLGGPGQPRRRAGAPEAHAAVVPRHARAAGAQGAGHCRARARRAVRLRPPPPAPAGHTWAAGRCSGGWAVVGGSGRPRDQRSSFFIGRQWRGRWPSGAAVARGLFLRVRPARWPDGLRARDAAGAALVPTVHGRRRGGAGDRRAGVQRSGAQVCRPRRRSLGGARRGGPRGAVLAAPGPVHPRRCAPNHGSVGLHRTGQVLTFACASHALSCARVSPTRRRVGAVPDGAADGR